MNLSLLIALSAALRFLANPLLPLAAAAEGRPKASQAPESSLLGADEWEFEPRIWSFDDERSEDERDFQLEESETDASQAADLEPSATKPEDYRKQQHYGGQAAGKNQSGQPPLPAASEKQEKCTQFRVDTREAVICDKSRCDKLEFDWPEHDNQLTVIASSKDGMRFHRSDFAFAPKQNNAHKLQGRLIAPSEVDKSERVKLDIFELFKPKPAAPSSTTTPAPSSTSAAPSSSTCDKDKTKPPTTTPAPTKEAAGCDCADKNTTQLITTFRLDTKRRKQTMLGFGGALSDSTCRNIKSLSPEMSKSLMEDYYGDKGLRYNIARMSMGSSDFSVYPYTNNDRAEMAKSLLKLMQQNTVDEGDDVEMENFRLTDEDYEFKLPIARQAIATSRQEIKFFSSLWSPPVWMKNNSHIVHGYLKGDVYGPYYKALAELMIKWLEAYRKNGIDFWGTTGLNEPVTGIRPFIFHNSLGITRDDYITFIKIYLGPLLKQRGFEKLKLMLLDDNKGYAPNWVKAALEDKEAAKYISGVAFHWYMNDEYENINFIIKNHSDKFIIHTEACNGYLPFQVHALPGNWDRGVAYMYDIIKMIQKNAVAWVDWNMALDLGGGPSWINNNLDAAVIVNAKRDEYYKSPMFYAMGHFSRFVEPNSVRLDYRLANAKYDYPVDAVGFHTPKDYIVIVALNANRYQVPFKIIVDKQLVRVVNLRANSFSTLVFKWKCNDSNHHHS